MEKIFIEYSELSWIISIYNNAKLTKYHLKKRFFFPEIFVREVFCVLFFNFWTFSHFCWFFFFLLLDNTQRRCFLYRGISAIVSKINTKGKYFLQKTEVLKNNLKKKKKKKWKTGEKEKKKKEKADQLKLISFLLSSNYLSFQSASPLSLFLFD